MSTTMFTSAECAIAELAFVFLLWGGCLLCRRVAGLVGCCWSHVGDGDSQKQDHEFFLKVGAARKTAVSCLSCIRTGSVGGLTIRNRFDV